MVVKSKFGRRRYIVFKIISDIEITQKDLIYTFNRILPKEPKGNTINSKNDSEIPFLRHRLKYFDGQYGILLTPHWLKPEAIAILQEIRQIGILKKPVKLEPLGTSGSLKKVRKKYLD